jgi:hypothetical protein
LPQSLIFAYWSKQHSWETSDLVTKFERERYFVEALAKILPLSVDRYCDPFDIYARETGVDVIAVVGSQQIGFQVTEYDGGEQNPQMKPGHMRAAEVKLKREVGATGVYCGWGSPDVERAFSGRVAQKVQKSLHYGFAEFDQVWLLVSTNIPGVGTSTFLPHFHIGSDDLNQWTKAMLAGSKYARAFLHVIMGDTLFGWDLRSGWRNLAGRH